MIPINGENLLLSEAKRDGKEKTYDFWVSRLHSNLGLALFCLFAVNAGPRGCLRAVCK